MSEHEIDVKTQFIQKIKQTLTSNGYPEKKVTLPLEKMYEVADAKKLNFNSILTELEQDGIGHEKQLDKILFFQVVNYQDLMGRFQGMNPADMMKDPRAILEKMSPAELKAIKDLYDKMSESEREQLMKQAKDMGLS